LRILGSLLASLSATALETAPKGKPITLAAKADITRLRSMTALGKELSISVVGNLTLASSTTH